MDAIDLTLRAYFPDGPAQILERNLPHTGFMELISDCLCDYCNRILDRLNRIWGIAESHLLS